MTARGESKGQGRASEGKGREEGERKRGAGAQGAKC